MTPQTHWRKYPRTLHHPLSQGVASDDKIATDLGLLDRAEVVITEKMDGENTTLYRDGFHARSLDSAYHPSRTWLAAFHATISHEIPEGWRLCGENLYARHAVAYDSLPGYFLAFSVWDQTDRCLPFEATADWLTSRGIPMVPVLYRGRLTAAALNGVIAALDTTRQEGFVIRTEAGFAGADFARHVVKWVRSGHVQTDQHWSKGPITPNRLEGEAR